MTFYKLKRMKVKLSQNQIYMDHYGWVSPI